MTMKHERRTINNIVICSREWAQEIEQEGILYDGFQIIHTECIIPHRN